MGDAIDVNTGRHASGRPSARGPAQAAWDQANPNYFTSGAGSFAYGQAQQGNQGGFAAYSQAQPQQQAQGTPYNPQQGQNFAGFGSQQGGAFSAWNPNIANDAQAPRPPAFQAQTFNFDGSQSQMPNFQQRDAFINNINTQLGQMQGQSWNQPMGAPQFDFPQMWGQAGQQVQQGFQNPFAGQPSGLPSHAGHTPPASPQTGQFQDIFQQFGFTPPAGFMDALIQRLQGGGTPQGGAGAALLPPPDHRAAYEQQQRQSLVGQHRDSLATNFGIRPTDPSGQVSDSQIWQAIAQRPQNFGPTHVQSLQAAGMVSEQEAAQLLQEVELSQRVALRNNVALHSQGAKDDPQFRQRAAQHKWNQEHGLLAQLPKRAQYAEFLTQRGVPPDEARQLAEQQYPVKTLNDEISRLGTLQKDLGRQLGLTGGAAQGDPAERARLTQESTAIADQIRTLTGQLTRAEQQQADAAKAQQAANRKAAQNTPEALAQNISRLQADLAAAKRGEAVPGVARTVQQREQELRQAQQQLAQSRQSAISQQGFNPSMFMEGGVFNMPAAREAWQQSPMADRQRALAGMNQRELQMMYGMR